MSWELLSSGTPDEFQAGAPNTELAHDTKMRLEMITTVPIAPLFDLWGADWVVSKMINEGGAHITDVEGIGWNKVVVHMKANGVWVPIIIGVIIAICIYFGISLFRELRLLVEKTSPIVWAIIGLVGAAIAIPLIMRLFKKRKEEYD